jgi:hypothetical protein
MFSLDSSGKLSFCNPGLENKSVCEMFSLDFDGEVSFSSPGLAMKSPD